MTSQRAAGNINSSSKRPSAITLAGLLEMDIARREHLIAPWLREGESAMIFAEPGAGKSLFSLALALAVAGGGEAAGYWNAPKPRRTLYVDGEMPLDDIKDRAAMLLPSVGGDAEAVKQNLQFMARQAQDPSVEFVDLADETSRESLISYALKNKIDLLVLDNLSTLATIDDENAASAFNAPIAFLLRLKQAGLACILVHHSSKNGESYRGSSKIATTFEVIIKLTRQEDMTDRLSTKFKLSWQKYRGKRDRSTGIDLDVTLSAQPFGPEGQERAVWTCEPAEDSRMDTMLALLESGQYATQRELAQAVEGGISQPMLTRLKKRAIAQCRISEKDWIRMLGNAKKDYAEDMIPNF